VLSGLTDLLKQNTKFIESFDFLLLEIMHCVREAGNVLSKSHYFMNRLFFKLEFLLCRSHLDPLFGIQMVRSVVTADPYCSSSMHRHSQMIFCNVKIPKFVTQNFDTSDPVFEELSRKCFRKVYPNEWLYFLGVFIRCWGWIWLFCRIKNFGFLIGWSGLHLFLEVQNMIEFREFQDSLSHNKDFVSDFFGRTPFDGTAVEGTFL
jgi:hypothetical protein